MGNCLCKLEDKSCHLVESSLDGSSEEFNDISLTSRLESQNYGHATSEAKLATDEVIRELRSGNLSLTRIDMDAAFVFSPLSLSQCTYHDEYQRKRK